ncbi:hypothetical protein BTVI_15414 [Pitangus sulphuratus]|nr:hypothetical protein BTVI_15414 [Pitangus sulphuratus]
MTQGILQVALLALLSSASKTPGGLNKPQRILLLSAVSTKHSSKWGTPTIPGSVQGQVRQNLEQPGIVEDVPAHGKGCQGLGNSDNDIFHLLGQNVPDKTLDVMGYEGPISERVLSSLNTVFQADGEVHCAQQPVLLDKEQDELNEEPAEDPPLECLTGNSQCSTSLIPNAAIFAFSQCSSIGLTDKNNGVGDGIYESMEEWKRNRENTTNFDVWKVQRNDEETRP